MEQFMQGSYDYNDEWLKEILNETSLENADVWSAAELGSLSKKESQSAAPPRPVAEVRNNVQFLICTSFRGLENLARHFPIIPHSSYLKNLGLWSHESLSEISERKALELRNSSVSAFLSSEYSLVQFSLFAFSRASHLAQSKRNKLTTFPPFYFVEFLDFFNRVLMVESERREKEKSALTNILGKVDELNAKIDELNESQKRKKEELQQQESAVEKLIVELGKISGNLDHHKKQFELTIDKIRQKDIVILSTKTDIDESQSLMDSSMDFVADSVRQLDPRKLSEIRWVSSPSQATEKVLACCVIVLTEKGAS
eukprot:745686-Hanusia_phi.AAC.6